MTVQDLKTNRSRIIRIIRRQTTPMKHDTISKVMNYMVKYIGLDEKPLMKNIDKLTNDCISVYIRRDYDLVETNEQATERKMQNLPSSIR